MLNPIADLTYPSRRDITVLLRLGPVKEEKQGCDVRITLRSKAGVEGFLEKD